MDSQIQAVYDAALALTEPQRGVLVRCLLATLPPDIEELSDDELGAELDRRLAEVKQGKAAAVSWSKMMKTK